MKEYDLYLPLSDNDGQPFAARMFRSVQNELLDQFGGVTFFPQPNEGLWQTAGVTYHDDIVIYRVITPHTNKARRFFRTYKEKLKRDFDQLEILIVERDVETL